MLKWKIDTVDLMKLVLFALILLFLKVPWYFWVVYVFCIFGVTWESKK